MDPIRQLQIALEMIEKQSLKRDQELEKRIGGLIRRQNLSDQISAIEQLKDVLAHLYDKASAYTNIVMIGGYAAIFGIWQLMKSHLTYGQEVLVAVLITISILLFTGFEVYKMISQAIFFRRLNRILVNFQESQQMQAWRLAFDEHSANQSTVWLYFLVPTVITGFGAGFILLYIFLGQV